MKNNSIPVSPLQVGDKTQYGTISAINETHIQYEESPGFTYTLNSYTAYPTIILNESSKELTTNNNNNMKKIQSITYDWYYVSSAVDGGEGYTRNEIGKCYGLLGEVVDIQEHRPAGEGDRWYYDIIFASGKIIRTFNPNNVEYQP